MRIHVRFVFLKMTLNMLDHSDKVKCKTAKSFNPLCFQDLVVNHVHPGYVDTDMTSHKGPLSIEEGSRCLFL